MIKDLNSQYKVDIYAEKRVLNELDLPSTDLINLIERHDKDFISCLQNSSNSDQIISDNLIWLNSRYIGMDFLEIKKAYDYKLSQNIDLLFSGRYLITLQQMIHWNL